MIRNQDGDDVAERSTDREPNPGQKPEKVEDRPNVSTVTPEDYPPDERAGVSGKGDRR
jgi:hypothetical protein